MRNILTFLILVPLLQTCLFHKKLIHKELNITVTDKKKNLPVDSARVTLISIIKARDINTEIRYTNSSGNCAFSFNFDSLTQYQIETEKSGLFSYYDENDVNMIKSFVVLDEKTGDNIVLFLTSDSLQQRDFWIKKTPRYEIDTLIYLLKSNNYHNGIPQLFWEDIPKLLKAGNDKTLINNFPVNPISSHYLRECYLGTISLWLIESVRIAEKKNVYNPVEKFPSQTPILRNKGEDENGINDLEKMKIAFQAYQAWWEKVKNADKKTGCKINPLVDTELEWK
jgi:hypothetical protein